MWTAASWLDPECDRAVIVRLCRGYDQAAAMRARIDRDGLVVNGSMGQFASHPLLASLRALEAELTKLEDLCGLNPMSRHRLNIVAGQKSSKLDELQRLRAKRAHRPKIGL